ncbi:uncharacterized protein FPRO_08593 [Fusarium proliferatum ET1]|uniref:GIY-YIG domain-containing protein n=1 Tax=Fusarium proliferatum (strain ET1) TaxID=1227346 RepID=A0A1L7W3K4_FUSPR|nr:uncharacterized protein FPRO_08593 [Fusarium proliferatum ET1]CZR47219.1 uncharacterized protein FPRO_08593 [Fusarium proliferatum ET1]
MTTPNRPPGPSDSSGPGRGGSSDRQRDSANRPSAGRGSAPNPNQPPNPQSFPQRPGRPATTFSGQGTPSIRSYFAPIAGPPPTARGYQQGPPPPPGRGSPSVPPPPPGRGSPSGPPRTTQGGPASFHSGSPSTPGYLSGIRPRAPTIGPPGQSTPQSPSEHFTGLRTSSSGPLPGSPLSGAQSQPARPRAPTIGSVGGPSPSLGRSPPGQFTGLRTSSSGALPASPLSRPAQFASASPSTPARPLPGSPSLGRGTPGSGSPSNRPLSGSPASGGGIPSRPRATTTSSSHGTPSKPPKLLYKTFRVTKELTASDIEFLRTRGGVQGFIPLKIGDFGVIPNITKNFIGEELAHYPQVQLLQDGPNGPKPRKDTPFPNGVCLVPSSIIEIGVLVKEEVNLVDAANLANPSLKLQLQQNASPLQRFFESFVNSMADLDIQKQLKLYGVPEGVVDIMGEADKRGTFVKELLIGMDHCGTLPMFENGLPKLEEIWSKCIYIDSAASNAQFNKAGTYYYLLLYYDENNEMNIACYIGRTFNLWRRYRQHSDGLSKRHSTLHYHMARKRLEQGASYRLFPIAYISNTLPNSRLFRSWAETILVVLFETFNPLMLHKSGSLELLAGDIPPWGRSPERDSLLQTSGTPLANLLQDVASGIKSSNAPLRRLRLPDPAIGLNWSVPLAEGIIHDTNLFVRTTTSGDVSTGMPAMWTFRTHPRRVMVDKRIAVLGGLGNNTQPPKFRPHIPFEGTNLRPGSLVNVVMEITVDPTSRHPFPYIQLPKPGPFDCWEEAFRLGIRIEFEEDGVWKTRYIKQEHFMAFTARVKSMKAREFGEEIDLLELSWLHSIKTIGALLNWRWQQDEDILVQRVWVPYRCRLRAIEFDFFKQQLVVADVPYVSKPRPKILTLDETADLIEQVFGEDVHIGSLPDQALIVTPGAGTRQKCDLCWVADRNVRMAKSCVAQRRVVKNIDGIDLFQCPFSAALGWYCTFTENVETREDLRDMLYRRPINYEVETIAPPPNVFQYLEIREKLNEEAIPEGDGEA